jgi:hypothetical protein
MAKEPDSPGPGGGSWALCARALLRDLYRRKPSVYRKVTRVRRRYRWEVASAMRREADSLPARLADRVRARAWKFVNCGSEGEFRQCDECGEIEAGTGRVHSKYPCHCLACDFCARLKSLRDAEELIAAMNRVPEVDGYAWRSIVPTLQRDPSDPSLYTVESLRERCIALQEAGRRAWKAMLGSEHCPCAAMLSKPECADEGHVHLHILYYGPYVPKAKLEAIVARSRPPTGCEWGFVDIQRARVDKDGLARELAKYVVKGPSGKSEGWLAGEPRRVMDPTLAARWEIALMGIKTSRVYGALREAREAAQEAPSDEPPAMPAEDTSEGEVPQNDCCPSCVWGTLRTVILPLEPTIQRQHARGVPALAGSRWRPRPGNTGPPSPVPELQLPRIPPPPLRRRAQSLDPQAQEIRTWLEKRRHVPWCPCPDCEAGWTSGS